MLEIDQSANTKWASAENGTILNCLAWLLANVGGVKKWKAEEITSEDTEAVGTWQNKPMQSLFLRKLQEVLSLKCFSFVSIFPFVLWNFQ